MANRVIAIGDIHGCSLALQRLLALVRPDFQDTIVTLGDYVNRGPDSRGVIDQLIRLRDNCTLVPLLGNHDQMLLANRAARTDVPHHEGRVDDGYQRFRDEHFKFLESCRMYHEIDTHFFVHANYEATKPLSEQEPHVLLWLHLRVHMPDRHRSGKTAVVGHTSQRSGEILDRGYLKCIDTYCYGGGFLTAIEVHTGQTWQAKENAE